MKFTSTVPVLALASTVFGQAQVIIGVVGTIQQGVTDFDTAIKGYNGGNTDALLQKANAVGKLTNDAVNTVKGSGTISLTDAVTVQGAVTGLQNALETTMNDLISKKPQLVQAGQGGTVEQNLQQQLSQAKGLQQAITDKVPTEARALAVQLSAGINQALQKAVDAFADAGGAPSASSGSGSGSGSSPSGSSGSSGMGSGSHGSSGTSSGSGSTISSGPKPAVFPGAASSFQVPVLGAIALVAAVLAL